MPLKRDPNVVWLNARDSSDPMQYLAIVYNHDSQIVPAEPPILVKEWAAIVL